MSLHDRVEFWFISIMHDKLYSLFMDGEEMLLDAELKKGNKVLEVGCGPGFFTLPAAKIVGETGLVYTIDINPFAVKKVKKKIQKAGVENVRVMMVDVRKTTLESQSVDHVFFFGVIHSLMNILDEILGEMYRILKEDGILVIQKSRKSTSEIIQKVSEMRNFEFVEEKRRMMLFKKKS